LCAAALFTHAAFAAKPPPPPPPPPQPSNGTLVLDISNAYNWGLTVAPSGTIYAVGNAYTGDVTTGRQVILSSSDSGNNWSMLDDYAPPGRFVDFWFGLGGGIACDALGNLYVSSLTYDNDLILPTEWYVRRSTDGGATWITVDDYVTASAWYGTDDIGAAADA